jgi:hypothetical protein
MALKIVIGEGESLYMSIQRLAEIVRYVLSYRGGQVLLDIA